MIVYLDTNIVIYTVEFGPSILSWVTSDRGRRNQNRFPSAFHNAG
jgi:hypothetical protein